MSRRGRFARPESFTTVTLAQLAREVDRTVEETRRLVRRAVRLGLIRERIRKPGTEHRYDAVAIEVLKAMIGVPHRPPPDPEDWLSDYLRGRHDP